VIINTCACAGYFITEKLLTFFKSYVHIITKYFVLLGSRFQSSSKKIDLYEDQYSNNPNKISKHQETSKTRRNHILIFCWKSSGEQPMLLKKNIRNVDTKKILPLTWQERILNSIEWSKCYEIWRKWVRVTVGSFEDAGLAWLMCHNGKIASVTGVVFWDWVKVL